MVFIMCKAQWNIATLNKHKNLTRWALSCTCLLSCVWLFWDALDCNPPGSSVLGILQARTLEWLPCSPPGDLPAQGWNPGLCLLHWQADSSPLSHLDVGISPTTNRPEGAVPQKNKEKEDSEIRWGSEGWCNSQAKPRSWSSCVFYC